MQDTIEGIRFALTTLAISGALVVLVMSIPKIRKLCLQDRKISEILAQFSVVVVCVMLSLAAGYFIFLK